jgi:transcriptional regulator with XRE-family HTH domain
MEFSVPWFYMDYPAYKKLPNTLKKYRKATGLRQRALAKLIGVDPGWLSHWESGDTLPNLISALRLSVILNIPVNELFGDLEKKIREEVHRYPT